MKNAKSRMAYELFHLQEAEKWSVEQAADLSREGAPCFVATWNQIYKK